MTPSVEGILDFVAPGFLIERAVPLGDIEYVDGQNRAGTTYGDPKQAPVAVGRIDDTQEMRTKDRKALNAKVRSVETLSSSR
jgi:hypothetical protein